MKKYIAFGLAILLMTFGLNPSVLAVSTYKYQVEVVNEVGNSVTSGLLVRVKKTDNTNTDATIWTTNDTTTGTLTGGITDDGDGVLTWYATTPTVDVIMQYRGRMYVLLDFAPGDETRIVVSDQVPPIDFDNVIPSADTMSLPLWRDVFQISGTTNINNIESTGHQIGKVVKLLFGGNLQIGQNGNITISQKFGGNYGGTSPNALSGTLTVGSGSLIEMMWDGTKWRIF